MEQTKEYLIKRLQQWVEIMSDELIEYTKQGDTEDMDFCRKEITQGTSLLVKLVLDTYTEEEYQYIQIIVSDLEERDSSKDLLTKFLEHMMDDYLEVLELDEEDKPFTNEELRQIRSELNKLVGRE